MKLARSEETGSTSVVRKMRSVSSERVGVSFDGRMRRRNPDDRASSPPVMTGRSSRAFENTGNALRAERWESLNDYAHVRASEIAKPRGVDAS